jgi:hypothetical protein
MWAQMGRRKMQGKGVSAGIQWKYYVLIYKKGKRRPTEIVPGMEQGGIKENNGEDEFTYDIL